MAEYAQARRQAIDCATGDHDDEAAGEFGQELGVLRCVTGRILMVRVGFIYPNRLGRKRTDTGRKFGVAGRQHDRMQSVRGEVAKRASAKLIVFPPAMEIL